MSIASISDNQRPASTDIAVVGVACRLPGANNPSEFWSLLRESREARHVLTDNELGAAGVPDALLRNPDYVKAGMFLQQMEEFDPGFFGFSPLDGRIMDPQHRQFLQCAWEALEDAGYDPARYAGSIGVFAGSGHNAYLPYNLLTNPQIVAEVGFFLLRHTGNDKDFLATRASYCFNLKGPSVNVQTACSTSLVAIHYAAQSLLNGECDMALAGGVTIELPHHQGYLYKESEILSRDGRCRPFDASAGGTVFGSGAGVVLLKRLDDALADGDNIHAVIKASAVNNDGAGKVSYLAPSVDGQAAAIQEALSIAEVDPRSVTYVETHGTGTQLGDPIEVAALTQAYGGTSSSKQYCAIGSVKSNIGHLDTAAGVASLIKVILAMKHRQVPATLHYTAPNPAIDFASTPFFVNAALRDWDAPTPLRAGVSSLGVGGTNAHLIVEEAPARESRAATDRPLQLLLLSGRSEQAVLRGRDRLARWLDDSGDGVHGSEIGLSDVAYTLAIGRRAFRKRAFVVAGDAADAVSVLDGGDRARFVQGEAPSSPREVAFMFAGGGAQYPGMGQGLYETEPVYRSVVDECLRLLAGSVDFDLKPLLYPSGAAATLAAATVLERPSRALPALFITQYAQARLWQSWGVEPAALIGHSMGENTAACLAGVIALRDALGLVALRGRLFETVGQGSMLSVELNEQDLLPLLGSDLSLAAINAPGLAVASGPKPALAQLEHVLTERQIGYQRVRIDVAAHSSMLENVLHPFGAYLRSISLHPPQIRFVSNLTGDWIGESEATDPDYWVRHLRHTVRFADGIGKLLETGSYALLEVGPGRTLSSLSGLHPARKPDQTIVTSLRHPDDQTPDLAHMLGALGRLWQGGAEPDWARFYDGQGRVRVSLPTYAFDNVRCWTEPGKSLSVAGDGGPDGEARREALAGWLYQPVWQRAAPITARDLSGARVLVLAADHVLVEPLLAELSRRGAELRIVRGGSRLDLDPEDGYTVRFGEADDYLHLVDAIEKSDWRPSHVLHLLALDIPPGARAAGDAAERVKVFDSLFYLAQAAGNSDWQALTWMVVSPQALQVGGEQIHSPLPALALGPVRVLPHEFPSWRCRLVDVESGTESATGRTTLAGRIVAELASDAGDPDEGAVVALRGGGRYVQRFVPRAASESVTPAQPVVREHGVYLITGGTGGLGLVAAAALADQAPATLVLLSRRALPDREYWRQLVEESAPEAAILQQLLELEARQARVVLAVGDVTDLASMRALAARLRQEYGPLHGIIHTAGVVDDGLLLSKDLQQSVRVLAPKLIGASVLDEVFGREPLDFVAFYSSTSALAGLAGQIDYTAANAYLDAFAHWRSAQGAPYVSLNWPAWRDTGMAARLAAGATDRRLPAGRPTRHPLLDRCIEESRARTVYATSFDVASHWVLHEHRIKDGPALIPGSGFIELARAAWAERRPDEAAIEISEAEFEFPFIVEGDDHKVLRVTLTPQGSRAEFSLTSEDFGETTEHARGFIGAAAPVNRQLDLDAVRRRCVIGRQSFSNPDHHPFMAFGPRWEALRAVNYGEGEALLDLELAEGYAAELDDYRLHPALVDMATAGAQVIIDRYVPAEEFYVPIGYRQLVFNGAFPQRAFSHVVFKPALDSGHSQEVASFDVTVCDDRGRVFLQVLDFSMRRLSGADAFKRTAPGRGRAEHPSLTRALALGIVPDEGRRVLMHVLDRGLGPQTLVSPFRWDYVVNELRGSLAPEAPAPTFDADADPEIGGVEAALAESPAIASVVVRSFMGEGDALRMVAYFVPDHDNYVTVTEIRRHARGRLRAALVPQQFVELDEWPVDDRGAVDRKALRDPLAPEDKFIAPRTTTEKSLARIWQDALGVERVGLSDNFFDLGGHSLLSVRVIVQVSKKLGVRLDQATMVLGTLEQISKDVDQRARVSMPDTATKPDPDGERQTVGAHLLRSLFGGKQPQLRS